MANNCKRSWWIETDAYKQESILVLSEFYFVSALSAVVVLFKVAHPVKLEQDISEQFYVAGPETGRSKIAPGMTANFMVFFTPQESKVLFLIIFTTKFVDI